MKQTGQISHESWLTEKTNKQTNKQTSTLHNYIHSKNVKIIKMNRVSGFQGLGWVRERGGCDNKG